MVKYSDHSYSTAAVHLYNGEVVDVGLVNAQPDYMTFFSRLSKEPAPPPPTRYQKFRRWFNKKLGQPSTDEVGILGCLIKELKEEVQSRFPEHNLDRVVVSTPLLPALTKEDINDAIEFAGMRTWLLAEAVYPKKLSETRAHYAGQGGGLCEMYQDPLVCQDEECDMPRETVYYVQ
jgi:hypothetical protein